MGSANFSLTKLAAPSVGSAVAQGTVASQRPGVLVPSLKSELSELAVIQKNTFQNQLTFRSERF